METIAEIQEMRVAELKEFLRRNEVQAASIARADGTDGPPRKSDLLGAALHIRADYENPQTRGPTSPKAPRNIFQSGFSPQSARTLAAETDAAPPPLEAAAAKKTGSPKRRASDVSSNAAMSVARKRVARPSAVADAAAGAAGARKPKPRRRSSGWINPAFNPQLTPKGSAAAAGKGDAGRREQAARASRRVEVADDVVEVEAHDFGDPGDQVVASDADSSAGGHSSVESDGGSVVDTDDDEGNPDQFKSMKVYEIRAWLNEHNVTFNHRSKKAELISLATAHALYLENVAAAAKEKRTPKPAPEREPEDDETTAFVEDEVEKVVPPPPPPQKQQERRRYPSRKSAEVKPVESANKADVVVAQAKDAPYRRSRSRVIAAPPPDDEKEAGVEPAKEDEIVPVTKPKRVKRRHVRKERPPKKAAWPAIRIPEVTMPTIVVTRRRVIFVVAAVLCVLLSLSLVNMWAKSKWPFCDTGAEQGIMPDGSECHLCPPNGHCENGKLSCAEGFFRSGKRCLEDQEVNLYAVHLERKIIRTLSLMKGKHECGETATSGLSEAQIRESVDPMLGDVPKDKRNPRKFKFDPSKFDAAFQFAIKSLQENEENDINYNSVTGTYEAQAGWRSFKCVVRQFLFQHIWYVFAIAALSIATARWRIRRFFRQREEALVERLYEAALEVLREVRLNFEEDDKGDAFMIDTQLREDLLGRTTHEKVKLWVKVEELLKADSRVLRSGPRSIKGMPCYVYEWRGNLRRPSSGSAGREGFRSYNGPDADTESRRRLSFGSASRRHSGGGYEASPGSPRVSTASPGYRNALNFWNRG